MTQTRIRSNNPSTVKITGSGGGTSTNPLGSSLTTEAFSIVITAPDSVATPTETSAFALKTSSADSTATPTEGTTFRIQPPTDTVATPTGAHSTSIRAGASTVTQTTGTGWTTPANAQGVNDGTNSVLDSPAGVTPATVTGTLTGVFNTLGTPSTETQTGTVVLTIYCTLSVPALGTGSLTLSYSVDSGTNYTVITTESVSSPVTATSFTAPVTVTLPGFLIANLASLRFRAAGSVLGTALAATTATVDAAVASFTTTGSAG